MNSIDFIMDNTKKKYLDRVAVYSFDNKKLIKTYFGGLFSDTDSVQAIMEKTKVSHSFVGLYVKQSVCLLVLILGCLKSRRPFTCLDIEMPIDVIFNQLEHLHIGIILIHSELCEKLKKIIKEHTFIEEFLLCGYKIQLWKTGEIIPQSVNSHKPDLMCAVQTSGSTGMPKTVQVTEQSILPNIFDLESKYNVKESDVILMISPPTFDPFLVELMLAMKSGAALFLVPPEVRVSPQLLIDVVFPADTSSLVTIAQFTPSLFTRWTSSQIRSRILSMETTLRVLALGGEKFPSQEFWKQCRAEGNTTQVYSLYGTTELSCWAMIGIGMDESLGTAMSQTILKVFDDSGHSVINGTGQLFIGSDTRLCLVGKECWDELKPPVFRATGDLVYVINGKYNYLGRMDNIVKRWGHKVNLDEIETTVKKHVHVESAVCVLHTQILGLFVSLKPGYYNSNSVKAELRENILKRLNKASQPDVIRVIDKIPLNRHGKTNRTELKTMLLELYNKKIDFENPERLLKSLWKKYNLNNSNEHTGFLKAGGNSVMAMMIANNMAKKDNNLSTQLISCMLNDGSLNECRQLLIRSLDNSELNSALTNCTTFESSAAKKKRRFDSDILFFKMKGSIHNLNENMRGDVKLKVSWAYNLRKCVDASPTCIVYKSGRIQVVVGSHSGRLAALKVEDGSLLWEVKLPDRIESSICPTLCSTEGLIGCYDGNVYCVSLESGLVIWKFQTAAMVKGSAVMVADSWIIGSYDYNVYCLKTHDGTLLWKENVGGIVSTTPFLLHKHLVIITSLTGVVTALRCDNGSKCWQVSLSSPIFSSPCIVEENIIVCAEVDGCLQAIEGHSGNKIWHLQVGGKVFSSLVNFNNMVIFGCYDKSVYCVHCSKQSPQVIWKQDLDSTVYATPTLLSSNYIVAASSEGHVFILDFSSGSIIHSIDLPGQIFSSPVTCGPNIIVGCRDDNCYCLTLY